MHEEAEGRYIMQPSVPNSMNWTCGSFPNHHWTVSEAFYVQNFRCWSTFAAAEAAGNSKRTNVHILTLLVIFIYFRTCTSLNHFNDFNEMVSDLHSVYVSFFFKNMLINSLKNYVFIILTTSSPTPPDQCPYHIHPTLCPFLLPTRMWLTYEGLQP